MRNITLTRPAVVTHQGRSTSGYYVWVFLPDFFRRLFRPGQALFAQHLFLPPLPAFDLAFPSITYYHLVRRSDCLAAYGWRFLAERIIRCCPTSIHHPPHALSSKADAQWAPLSPPIASSIPSSSAPLFQAPKPPNLSPKSSNISYRLCPRHPRLFTHLPRYPTQARMNDTPSDVSPTPPPSRPNTRACVVTATINPHHHRSWPGHTPLIAYLASAGTACTNSHSRILIHAHKPTFSLVP